MHVVIMYVCMRETRFLFSSSFFFLAAFCPRAQIWKGEKVSHAKTKKKKRRNIEMGTGFMQYIQVELA